MDKIDKEKMSYNKFCASCGGKCCKSMGCELSTRDMKSDINKDTIKELLESGMYSIDYWDYFTSEDGISVDEGYFIRARNKNSPVVDPSWGGECVMLTDTGCSLSFEDRPFGGKSMIAKQTLEGECKSNYGKHECAIEWFKYYDILRELVIEYRGY